MAQGEANASDPREDLFKRVENDLTLHPPVAAYIGEGIDILRVKAKEFAYQVIDKGAVPSREVSMALTKIEEALFYAIASIARYQPDFERPLGEIEEKMDGIEKHLDSIEDELNK